MNFSDQDSFDHQPEYSTRTPEYYLTRMDSVVYDSLTTEQIVEIRKALQAAMPAPSPKIVDLRVNIDLILSRFYIVLFVGKDRRKKKRKYAASGMTVFANRLAAIGLLVGLNITISLFIFLVAYLLKSALGINLFAGHLSDYLNR